MLAQKGTIEKRSSERILLENIQLPFLGSRVKDKEVFQYLVLDVSQGGIKMALPDWLVSRIHLKLNDIINFHLPIIFNDDYYSQGQIVWLQWEENLNSQIYGISFTNKKKLSATIFLSIQTHEIIEIPLECSLKSLLLRSLKDSIILKKGVIIYLKHLVPFFSRFSGYSQADFPMLKEILFKDMERNIRAHQEILENLHSLIASKLEDQKDIPTYIDLEELRTSIESEIYPEIFNAAFENNTHNPYVLAIKDLEETLYSHYNKIVLIYLKSMSS